MVDTSVAGENGKPVPSESEGEGGKVYGVAHAIGTWVDVSTNKIIERTS